MENWHEQRVARLEQLSKINYPADLPITENIEKIKTALQQHQVIIVAGDTGSGKTTQLPKICLELQRGRLGRIGHTQPRRIAARAVAQRVAEELQTVLGDVIGYKTRFREHLSPQCAVKIMTDGILLAEMQQDRMLRQYDTLIIDEAHERSVNIDFILGYLKQLLPKRPDLKIIVTSATLDINRFAEYFNKAPIIEVEGRSYPIEIIYKSVAESDEDSSEVLVNTVADLLNERKGNILVFLPTERVIHEVEKSLKGLQENVEILPLYSRLSVKDQNKIFAPANKLRVILSTNVAETSLTVPGIRYVIDEGSARINRYSQRMKVQRLPIERISQASARQRAGRCGRIGPGKCVRLYSREDFESRDEFTLPEILRTNLAQVILRMAALRLGKIEAFPFIQPPNPRFINDGYQLLFELGALDSQKNLTSLGAKMAKLPIDPRLSRLLIAGSEMGCLAEMTIIASFLEAQDPRIRPKEKLAQADQVHAQYQDKKSDFISILNLWNSISEKKKQLSKNQFSNFCEKNYISVIRFNEWHEIHAQLNEEAANLGRFNQQPANYEMLHTALLYSYFTKIACKQEKNDYLSTRGNRIKLFPGSGVFKSKPQWIMAGLLLETEQLYAHLVATIEPEWVIKVAPHWVKRHYGEPTWEKNSQRVTANCRTTLLGLTLQDKQRVNYETIDPLIAREIFIRAALVMGEWQYPLDFFIKNQQALAQAKQLEEQSRRRDIVADEELLYTFYAQQLPLEITGVKKLESWYRECSLQEKQNLLLTQDYIIRGLTAGITREKFPGHIIFEGTHWALKYNFAPGSPEDGITVTVTLESLTQVPYYLFEWLVPGFLTEKVEALLRNLPKTTRKKIMPLVEVAQKFVQTVAPVNQPLIKILATFLEEHYHCRIEKDQWSSEGLPAHLFINYQLVDKATNKKIISRDYDQLVFQFADTAKEKQSQIVQESLPQFSMMTSWTCGDLPLKIKITGNGHVDFYPALKDEGESVSVSYFENESEAKKTHQRGVLRLLFLLFRQDINYLKKNFAFFKSLLLTFCKVEELVDDLLLTSLARCFLAEAEPLPRTAQEFETLLVHKKDLIGIAQKMAEQLKELLLLAGQIKNKIVKKSDKPVPVKNISFDDLKSMKSLLRMDMKKDNKEDFRSKSFQDIQQQLDALMYPGFIATTPLRYWARLPVYLQGILLRLEKMANNPNAEKNLLAQFEPALAKYQQMVHNAATPRKLSPTQRQALENYRWMLEEYRLSLFSQPIKTIYKISDKRLDEEWQMVIG